MTKATTEAFQRQRQRQRSMPVCVLGPGRSGTSMTMRILNLLGVHLGTERDLAGPGPGAPKGFWERPDMVRFHDQLLRAQGGTWRNPPRLEPGWEEEVDASQRNRAHALLERIRDGRELWGWKDPRASLTTAFWISLVPNLRFVICLRNPIDFAASITPPEDAAPSEVFYYSRRGPRGEDAYRHWLAYVAGALANTVGRPRMLVSYDDHFECRRQTVARLARFVGREPPQPGSELDRRLDDFIDDDLRHHRTPPEQVVADERLPAEVASLYLVSELLHARQSAFDGDADPRGATLAAATASYARGLLESGAAEFGRTGAPRQLFDRGA